MVKGRHCDKGRGPVLGVGAKLKRAVLGTAVFRFSHNDNQLENHQFQRFKTTNLVELGVGMSHMSNHTHTRACTHAHTHAHTHTRMHTHTS